ncbi:ketoacyl-ACP synthase III [bacterium]|nr:ketoacyl-ACP synthase III [bacterium]
MLRSKILSTGMYVPPRVVTNNDLAKVMDTSDEWIRQRTGIEQRYWVDAVTNTSDLALRASEIAIKNANLDKAGIEMIILATLSPDHEFPGTACFLQKKLGLPGIPALDVRQQCTGFIYSLSIADQFIRNGVYKNILVVGAEVHSKGLEQSDRGRDVSVLFGDGAGAVVLAATEITDPKTDSHILSTHLHADGSFAEELWTPAPGTGNSAERVGAVEVAEGLHYPKMNGKTVFMHAVKRMPEALVEALDHNKVRPEEVDLFVFHQANLRINDMIAKQFQIPDNKVFNTIQKYANTTAATIPIGLDEAVRAGKLKKGMLVASAAFGSGFTWGSALYRF